MKKLLFITVILAFSVTANASLFTMDFANSTLDLGASNTIDLTNQYSSFGLTFDRVYRYGDDRDPWGDQFYGIANGWPESEWIPSMSGTVYFSELTNYVAFDWWSISTDRDFYMDAFGADGTWLGGGSFGVDKGQNSISAIGIDHIVFRNTGGTVGISTLTYERGAAAIPEPATMFLLGLGMAGLGIIRRKRS